MELNERAHTVCTLVHSFIGGGRVQLAEWEDGVEVSWDCRSSRPAWWMGRRRCGVPWRSC